MDDKYAQYILDKLNTVSDNKYTTKGETLVYKQGVLLGLLVRLAKQDSHNLDIIIKRLENIK